MAAARPIARIGVLFAVHVLVGAGDDALAVVGWPPLSGPA
jgi:hypothetical protein